MSDVSMSIEKDIKESPPTKKPKSKFEEGMKRWGIPIAIIVFLLLFYMPTPEGLTPVGQKSIAIFTAALILWITTPIPIYLTSMMAILLLPLIGAVKDQEVAFATLGFDVIWLMVSAFILTSAMIKSNLGRRFALWMVTTFGRTPKMTLLVLIIINFVLAFFVPSTTARATLMVPICLILLEVYKAIPGESNLGRAMMLQGVQADAVATSGVMTATSSNIIAVGFINDQAGGHIGYMDWLLASMPTAIITMIITFFIGIKLFSIKGESNFQNAMGTLKEELKKLGKFSLDEKKASIIFIVTVILWATGDYHKNWFGFEISTEQTAVLAGLLCLLPRIGLLNWKEANIKWELMVFAAGAYAVGNALDKSKGAEWIIKNVVSALGLEQMSHTLVYIVVIFLSMYSHLIFTSKTVRVTILIPAFIALAKSLGMDPVILALAAAMTMTYTITLPPHSKVNTIYFATGYFSVLDQIKYAIITCFVGASVISLSLFTWFKILGL
ncbi:DASS family sodium-coupled anion symporter [Paenibacillus sp. GD4]|jgi:solute carrier family 13 (sodium-dependent dicarboxylate transporter), member 2/3/5|uniref:SLC13 family permease n=1 Tax=Paenibacillus sp. GD4 TaxID=3068890 RepID=UPI0027967E88|nr:DASS family sodium-coupled anion symporter [Paenibacillus sp. GD4]MDQ1913554.1 DASS family sodium-coupled anion symporter [Paenibacillus sp. GD4]